MTTSSGFRLLFFFESFFESRHPLGYSTATPSPKNKNPPMPTPLLNLAKNGNMFPIEWNIMKFATKTKINHDHPPPPVSHLHIDIASYPFPLFSYSVEIVHPFSSSLWPWAFISFHSPSGKRQAAESKNAATRDGLRRRTPSRKECEAVRAGMPSGATTLREKLHNK